MYDAKLVAKNFRIIREHYNLKQKVFANQLFISERSVQEYEAGRINIPEDVLKRLSARSGISLDEIMYTDLTDKYKKGDGIFDESQEVIELAEEIGDGIFDAFKVIYPIIQNSEKESDNFNEAVKITNDMGKNGFDFSDIIKCINLFIHAYNEDKVDEAAVNVLSCFGYAWDILAICSAEITSDNFDGKVASYWEFTENAQKNIDIKKIDINRKAFLDKNNSLLTKYMGIVKNNPNYSDYSYYFLAMRYLGGMLDEDITKLSKDEMTKFGSSMLDCLSKMGNKYAKAFLELKNEEE